VNIFVDINAIRDSHKMAGNPTAISIDLPFFPSASLYFTGLYFNNIIFKGETALALF
jgi:hypothetical protein